MPALAYLLAGAVRKQVGNGVPAQALFHPFPASAGLRIQAFEGASSTIHALVPRTPLLPLSLSCSPSRCGGSGSAQQGVPQQSVSRICPRILREPAVRRIVMTDTTLTFAVYILDPVNQSFQRLSDRLGRGGAGGGWVKRRARRAVGAHVDQSRFFPRMVHAKVLWGETFPFKFQLCGI